VVGVLQQHDRLLRRLECVANVFIRVDLHLHVLNWPHLTNPKQA
jgi:hypothetical protein